MGYYCKECNTKLQHINCEHWLCENCFKIIEIPLTKNWSLTASTHTIKKEIRNKNVIYHEIKNTSESKNLLMDLVPKLMEVN